MTVSRTKQIAAFAATLTFDSIPTKTVEHLKRCVLDAFGCGLFGSQLTWSRLARETLADLSDPPTATVWGTGLRLSPVHAALVNGTAVHAFELDDLHKRAIVHPGGVTIPAVLGAAEFRGIGQFSGRDLLTAVAVGYEVGIRVGMATGMGLLHRGWHNNPVLGTFAGAAGAGRLLRLTPEQMEHALGMAATFAGGLMAAQYGSMVKRLHAGRAAQSGIYAALLASRGFTGIENVLEPNYGSYPTTFVDAFDMEQLTKDLGQVWETDRVGFKYYSACGSAHTTIDAVLRLREQAQLRVEDVEQIDVYASTATRNHVGWEYRPSSVTTAQMNLAYSLAVALTDGQAFVDQYSPDRLADPRLLDLTRRVTVHADPDIDRKGREYRHAIRMVVRLKDGRELRETVDHAKGSEYHPLTDEELRWKFTTLANRVLPAGKVEQLEQVVRELDRLERGDKLTAALCP